MMSQSFPGWVLLASSLLIAGCSSDNDNKSSNGSKCLAGAEKTEHLACDSCLEHSCGSQYSALCEANCQASSSSTNCRQATDALTSCAIQQCAVDCGVEDSGSAGAGSGSAGSSSAGSSSAGSSSAGSSSAGSSSAGSSAGGSASGGDSSSGGSGAATATASCYQAADAVCTRTQVPQGFLSQYDMACTQQNGQPTCPSAGLIGCCALGDTKFCVYTAQTINETNCPQIGGKWSRN